MCNSVGKPKKVLPYISPYLSSCSNTCSCVQNTATDAAMRKHIATAYPLLLQNAI